MSKLKNTSVSHSSPPSSTLSSAAVQKRIAIFMGHSVKMLESLEKQNTAAKTGVILNSVYEKGYAKIYKLNAEAFKKFGRKEISKSEIKGLAKELKILEKKLAEIIRDTQVEAASEIGESIKPGTKNLVAALAANGWKATFIRFLGLVFRTHSCAVQAFNSAREAMVHASRNPFPVVTSESQVESDRRAEFAGSLRDDSSLKRRSGVIGVNGIYRIQVSFSKEHIQKQLKSFTAQNLSSAERRTIDKDIQLGETTYKSLHVPLNQSFDAYYSLKGGISTVFTNIFGNKGISSANRQELHLVNGYDSSLVVNKKTIFSTLRHGILSAKNEKDPAIREQISKKAAEELLKAALLKEIAAQGLTLGEAQEKGIELNLNSVSLVTPDDFRQNFPGQNDEKMMLLDQILALESKTKEKFLDLDGIKIPVKINVNAFNFGVNYISKNLKWGLSNQYQHNLNAMEGLRNQFADFYNLTVTQILEPGAGKQRKKILTKALANAEILMKDVELLMANKSAYLQGKNQYEIGAKILNLTHLMDRTTQYMNRSKVAQKRISGFKSALNCMSAKDRTETANAVAKTYAIMAEENHGIYRSHAELEKEPELAKRFAEILATLLLEEGGLEITEINTGAKGYKVGQEARLFGMPKAQFEQAQGLSKTTSS